MRRNNGPILLSTLMPFNEVLRVKDVDVLDTIEEALTARLHLIGYSNATQHCSA